MKLRAFLYAAASLLWIAVPMVAMAAGLLPVTAAGDCGNASTAAQACNICAFGSLIQNIINFAIGLSIPVAAILFSYAGWLYFTNRENTSKIEQAHKIFSSVLIGFAIAVAGWLIVQTILKTLAPGYQSWTTFTCNATRPMDTNLSQLFQQSGLPNVTTVAPISVGGSAYTCQSGTLKNGGCYDSGGQLVGSPTISSSPDNSGLTCMPGYSLAGGKCYNNDNPDPSLAIDPVPAAPGQVGVGDCSPGALTADFSADSSTMSCIARRESGCSTVSQGDKLGAMPGYYASIGTYQINMSNHQVQCDQYNNGQPVNCPSAYSGPVTGRTMNTVTIVNQGLYQQCKTMLMNPDCNSQVAQGVLNTEGFGAWSTYKQCGGV